MNPLEGEGHQRSQSDFGTCEGELRREIAGWSVAVVQEWISARAGSEKVFETIAQLFPTADLYALTREPSVDLRLGGRRLTTTALDRPSLRDRRALTLPLMPLAWSRIERLHRRYDLVVTSTHAFARAFPPAADAFHLDYCHTPMRYAWTPHLDRRTRRSMALYQALGAPLRRMDLAYARRVNAFAANSAETAERIGQIYGRSATVIHPPVDTDFYTALPLVDRGDRTHAVAFSRFVPYKRLDIAIEACGQLGMPLVVAGRGPQEAELRKLAAPYGGLVRFEVSPTDARVRELLRYAKLLLFPAREDFGIIPLEAQAAGTPVLALGSGGTRETVDAGRTGHFAGAQTATAFAQMLASINWDSFKPEDCRQWSAAFSESRFRAEFSRWAGAMIRLGFG